MTDFCLARQNEQIRRTYPIPPVTRVVTIRLGREVIHHHRSIGANFHLVPVFSSRAIIELLSDQQVVSCGFMAEILKANVCVYHEGLG